MEILSKLFGSAAKVKIMRLFLFNPEVCFDVDDIMTRARVERDDVWRELSILEKVNVVRRRTFYKRSTKKRVSGFVLNAEFPYLAGLQKLLIETITSNVEEFLKRFRALGKLKLVLAAGVFIQSNESRADLLIVGEGIKRGPLENVIKGIEAEIGKELRYAYFETPDFTYRLNMFDKLVRDVIDYPHQILLDRLGLLAIIPQR